MSIDSSTPKTEDDPSLTPEDGTGTLYAIEIEKNRKLNRASVSLFAGLTIVSTSAFIGTLGNRLSQLTKQPDGSFPISHWLDTWMFIAGILSITFFISAVFLANKTWPHRFQFQPIVAGVATALVIAGSIFGVAKIMDTTWETNMKSWAMDRYGIEYETINKGWTPPVMGDGGCTISSNPFTPNGLRYTTSCDVVASGKDTYLLVTKEGRYAAELLYSGYGYKAYKATATQQPEELPVLNP